MRIAKYLLLACTGLSAIPVAAEEEAGSERNREIVVSADALESGTVTKTNTPAIEVPQPVTVISSEVFEAQGAVSISDTLNYVSGVQSNPYGPDTRADWGFVRGLDALQFRDGMRDVFSYYATIRADPYNFESVQVLRGPSSVLFGAGSLGGIINLESKLPRFMTKGEVSLRYGSHDRKEALVDVTGPLGADFAARVVARVRDSGTQTDFVPDDRILIAPSLTWQPTMDTSVTLLGLYQEDDGGSTSQFLPLVGTILPNPNGRLPSDLFIGKPGWDRYDGRLWQGTGLVEHRFSDAVKVNLKARYVDSDLTYLTHYPDNYATPANPFLDPGQRLIGLYSDGTHARMEIFTADNNVQLNFATGEGIEHTLLAGVDYSWNHVRKRGGFGYEVIDIYDIDYDAINGWDGGLPQPEYDAEDVEQRQLGFYVQDQIRLYDRVSIMFGARRDDVWSSSFAAPKEDWSATTFRAGIIGEVAEGVSPFFSYTESFEPISGTASNGSPYVPKSGRQYEAGVKFQPNEASLITLTGYHIKETNRPIDDPSTPDPFDQMQAGSLTSKGVELEARTELPGKLQLIANYSYNEAEIDGTDQQLENVPRHNASLWASRPFALTGELDLILGGGVRYSGKNRSYGLAGFPNGIVTPSYTLVDAFAELNWQNWSFALNATNLLGKDFYSACLARGDCFIGAARNVYGTVSYRF
jgi:iron complex outermembrane receptor protein